MLPELSFIQFGHAVLFETIQTSHVIVLTRKHKRNFGNIHTGHTFQLS